MSADIKERLQNAADVLWSLGHITNDQRLSWVEECIGQFERDIASLQSRIGMINYRKRELETEVSDLRNTLAAKQGSMVAAQAQEVFAFRRKVLGEFCTCSKERYEELAQNPSVFDVAIFYAAPPSPASANDLVKAALEAAAKVSETNAAFYAVDTPSDIRAIDPQTIVDEVSK